VSFTFNHNEVRTIFVSEADMVGGRVNKTRIMITRDISLKIELSEGTPGIVIKTMLGELL